ncbi:MAG: thioesterase family protein [Planctomycetota bacterium]|nr:thioesterase family protein [Planctomycetota bacterium]MDA1163433.1 thioesterase family protein [Planctomycetota bacterium]
MLKEHEIQIRVRYVEADPMGYLHHSNYFTYFEMGRTELFRASGGNYREIEESGQFLVVTKLECRFLAPARYDDELTLRTTIARASMAKLEHAYELRRGDTLLTSATSVLACVDSNGRVQRMPDCIIDG